MKKKSIELTKEQRAELEEVVKKGQAPARKRQHAQVLLKIDSGEAGPNWADQQVKEAFNVSLPTVWRIRQRFLVYGLSEALNRRPQPERLSLSGGRSALAEPRPDNSAQMSPRSLTASRSSTSSAAVASIRPREKSSMSRPCTISQSPPFVVTG